MRVSHLVLETLEAEQDWRLYAKVGVKNEEMIVADH